MASRRELIVAVATRYGRSTRSEKESILDEFTQVTGFHRKHAIRVLNGKASKVRLLASDRVSSACKQQLRERFAALDPVELLRQIREAQRLLASLEVTGT